VLVLMLVLVTTRLLVLVEAAKKATMTRHQALCLQCTQPLLPTATTTVAVVAVPREE
jgi:hypothetical protein